MLGCVLTVCMLAVLSLTTVKLTTLQAKATATAKLQTDWNVAKNNIAALVANPIAAKNSVAAGNRVVYSDGSTAFQPDSLLASFVYSKQGDSNILTVTTTTAPNRLARVQRFVLPLLPPDNGGCDKDNKGANCNP